MSKITLLFGHEDKLDISVESQQEKSSIILFEIPTQISFFDGHFPGNPIVPAVAIIEISLAIARALKMLPSAAEKPFKGVSDAKFLAALKPGNQIRVLVTKSTSVDLEWQSKSTENEWKKCGLVELTFV